MEREWWHLLSHVTVTHDGVLLFWKFCWWEVVNELLATRGLCTAFAVTIQLPLTPSLSFPTFLILSPISPLGNVWVSGAELPAGVRPWEQVSWGMCWHKHLQHSLTCSVNVWTAVLLITAAVENPLQIHRISILTLFLCWSETHAGRKNLKLNYNKVTQNYNYFILLPNTCILVIPTVFQSCACRS